MLAHWIFPICFPQNILDKFENHKGRHNKRAFLLNNNGSGILLSCVCDSPVSFFLSLSFCISSSRSAGINCYPEKHELLSVLFIQGYLSCNNIICLSTLNRGCSRSLRKSSAARSVLYLFPDLPLKVKENCLILLFLWYET